MFIEDILYIRPVLKTLHGFIQSVNNPMEADIIILLLFTDE